MDRNIWTSPEKTRILAGNFPLSVFLSDRPFVGKRGNASAGSLTTGIPPLNLKTAFHMLAEEGSSVMAYSQRRPASGYAELLRELEGLLRMHHHLMQNGLILITHSRGGLIARKAIEELGINCSGLVTIATPHHGSDLLKLSNLLSGISKVIYPLFQDAEKESAAGAVKRIAEFLKSDAVREIKSGSTFIRELDDERLKSVKTLSIGGTDPLLFTLYRWQKDIRMYEKLFSFPELLANLIPDGLLPEELAEGKGDGMVRAVSSEAPYALEHCNIHLNHAKLLFDQNVNEKIVRFVKMVS